MRVLGSDIQQETQKNKIDKHVSTEQARLSWYVQICDVPRINTKCYQAKLGNFQAAFFYLELFHVANSFVFQRNLSLIFVS